MTIFTPGSKEEMEFFRLKDVLGKYLNLKLEGREEFHHLTKHYFIEVLYFEPGLDRDLVTYSFDTNPERVLPKLIKHISGRTVVIYKFRFSNKTYSFLKTKEGAMDEEWESDMTYMYRKIHIPEFQTANELKMKLELTTQEAI